MFEIVRPEEVGISSSKVLEFMKIIDEYSPATHSFIMARGNKIFHECYYAPFNKEFKHRMYSVSKSFVSLAVGLLIEDGLLNFDDKFIKFFEKYTDGTESEWLNELTIRDMLTMSTGNSEHINWFTSGTDDRSKIYFKNLQSKIPGTIFDYDSPGSFMLNVIVEEITGKPFLEFLQERFLNDIGFSKDAYCLKEPGGHSFGDSGVMCTSRDLLKFARFVMNKGTWNGKRYMNEQYLTAATTKQVDNNDDGTLNYNRYGYGYKFWMSSDGTFSCNGMGGQFAICDPKHDFIFIINADNQGNTTSHAMLYHALFHHIRDNLGEALPQNDKAYNELIDYSKTRELFYLRGNTDSDFKNSIDNVTYIINPDNPMKISKIRFNFSGKKGTLTYTNATGEKSFDFGFGYNEFCKFPEEGYSDMVATEYAPGNKYDCAFSACWAQEKQIRIKAQIIDKYFGNGVFIFSFKDDRVQICMRKTAEAFMEEYQGYANGHKE